MRTIQTTVYQFGELNDEAKGKARAWYREGRSLFWDGEYQDTLNAFCSALGIKWDCCDIDRMDIRYRIQQDENILELSYVRLWKWLQAQSFVSKLKTDCPFTGFCADEDILQPLREFLERPTKTTLQELIGDCLYSWLKAYCADVEYQNSDEAVDSNILANEYEFTKDGKRA